MYNEAIAYHVTVMKEGADVLKIIFGIWENGNISDLEQSMFIRIARANINSEVSTNIINWKRMIRQMVGIMSRN